MASRKTDPQPFPTRGTPTGYRDIWDADDSVLIQAQIAERERLLVAVRESAGPRRGGSGRASRKSCPPASPADRIATDP
jgi:hypothetical protein